MGEITHKFYKECEIPSLFPIGNNMKSSTLSLSIVKENFDFPTPNKKKKHEKFIY